MQYTEEPVSKLESLVGRRMPIALMLIATLWIAAYFRMDIIVTGALTLIGAVVGFYFPAIAQENQDKQVLRQQAIVEANNGKE